MKLLPVICLLLAQGSAKAYKFYEDKIPNGIQVPHPCRPNVFWKGVGHEDFEGGGKRNPFGVDFANNNKVWDRKICQMDSDGDGKTNGAELGDPNCTWKADTGEPPERLTGLSHPGICEPVDSERCQNKNTWDVCTDGPKFQCEGIKEPGVMNTTLRVMPTKIPVKDTSYYCILLDLPSDDDYHLIATTPVIDNPYVMHHMVLTGCDDNASDELEKYKEPSDCLIMPQTCSETLSIWTLGDPGNCYDGPYGFRMGTKGVRKALLQFHWTNVDLRTDYVDSSGMTLYYTKNLRKYDGGVTIMGQTLLPIPPQMSHVEHIGWCSSECSKKTLKNETIYIAKSNLHMHYLGDSGGIEMYRNGKKDQTLIWQDSYDYDSPLFVDYKNVIEFKAGDAIKITCNYKSTSRQNMTEFGEGTLDEMCFGLFWYYPKISDTYCGQHGDYEVCYNSEDYCQAKKYAYTNEAKDIIEELSAACDAEKCTSECVEKMREAQLHPCFQASIGMSQFITELYKVYDYYNATVIFQKMMSCGLNPKISSAVNEINPGPIPSRKPSVEFVSANQVGSPQMNWKEQVEYMRAIKEIACGTGSTIIFSTWLVAISVAFFIIFHKL